MLEGQSNNWKFVLVINTIKTLNDTFAFKSGIINDGTPVEIIIMQLKAYLKNLEKDYFNKYPDISN